MILFFLGYFALGLIFLIFRFFYHISKKNLVHGIKKDFFNVRDYYKKIISSNPKKMIFIASFIAISIFLILTKQINDVNIFDYFVSSIVFFLMIIIFAPRDEPENKKFPVEIFGFIYSIVMMYCSLGDFIIEFFSENNFFHEDMWIFGYSVVIISYLICIASLSRFMEKNLSRIEIIFVGMIMMTILEFMTYYGIGFFGGIKFYNPHLFENNVLEGIATIVNQGIYIASQSQILGNIILNGTDVLTVTAVLGYVLQKFMGLDSNSK